MRLLPVALIFLFASGCATMQPGDPRRVAEMDHATCVDRGHSWPSERYERCRWELQEDRHRRTWENMQLMERPRVEGTLDAREHYRPLPRINFRCRERLTDEGDIWVDCGNF